MYEQLAAISRKGQVTVPAEIRRALNLKEGDKLVFSLVDATSGEITVRPVRSVADLTAGVVTPRQYPEDLKRVREDALDEVAEDALAETPSGPTRPV
jgi:AbrB family looped-hinge helix DNA binding protein